MLSVPIYPHDDITVGDRRMAGRQRGRREMLADGPGSRWRPSFLGSAFDTDSPLSINYLEAPRITMHSFDSVLCNDQQFTYLNTGFAITCDDIWLNDNRLAD